MMERVGVTKRLLITASANWCIRARSRERHLGDFYSRARLTKPTAWSRRLRVPSECRMALRLCRRAVRLGERPRD